MAKSILFASIFATAVFMMATSLTPAMAEWTYGSEENRGVTTFDAEESVWTYGSEENRGVTTFDTEESVWTYGSFGISEGTSFQATSVWTYGSEENRGVTTFDTEESVWTVGSEENKGVTTFDAEESVWTVGSYQFGAMTESKPLIEAPETANSEISTIQEDDKKSAGTYCVQTRLGLSCN